MIYIKHIYLIMINIKEKWKKKYSVDNLFKNKNNITQVDNEGKNIAMVEYKESVFKRIINKIKNIFHK